MLNIQWWQKLSFRWIILLTPVTTFALTIIIFILFSYIGNQAFSQHEKFQDNELKKSQLLTTISNNMASNHVQIYEHMRTAKDSVDEGEFYDKGKILLLEIHSAEQQVQNYLKQYLNDLDIVNQLSTLNKKLISYRINTTNAILMTTVDLKLAQGLLRDSTRYYIELNNNFLSISQFIQKRMRRQSALNYKSSKNDFINISVVSILSIACLTLLSLYLSKKLSLHFHLRILALYSLLSQNKPTNHIVQKNNEIEMLSAAINSVKLTFEALENANLKLSQQEKQLRSILDNMMHGVISINERGIILNYNKAAENVFGYSTEEIIGQNITILMPTPLSNQLKEILLHSTDMEEGHIVRKVREVEGMRKHNKVFPMLLSSAKLPITNNGNPVFIVSIQDLSVLKKSEDQLRQSQKMEAMGKLTGGIAHDYNNMLGVILGYSELLESELTDHPALIEYVKAIRHASERGTKLTKNLLTFSKHKRTNPTALNINTVLQNNKDMLEITLTARIQISYELRDELWDTYIDSSDLTDAILNISINAMHAIDGNGEVIFRTNNEQLSDDDALTLQLNAGDYVVIRVVDTGSGMDKTTQEKIFDPFFTSKGDKGTGLGLSQVYAFIHRSHGAIKVYSEVGHGTLMTLYFPRYQNNSSDNNQSKSETDSNSQLDLNGSETILTVDDEPALLKIVSTILTKHGYHVICASTTQQALDILKNKKVDLLLSDVIMPDMDGFQLAKKVQKIYPTIKIQLASGFSDTHHRKDVDKNLVDTMLFKPYKSLVLLQKIRQLLNK